MSQGMAVRDVDVINELCMQQLALAPSFPPLSNGKERLQLFLFLALLNN